MSPINADVLSGNQASLPKEVLPEVETDNGNGNGNR